MHKVEIPLGKTYRTFCGKGRITYQPDWSRERPWASYWEGSPGICFATIAQAVAYFSRVHKVKLLIS